MIIRCVRSAMLLWLALVGGGAWFFLTWAGDPAIYSHHYLGKAALLGLIVIATRGAEIFGLNPVMLASGIFCLTALALPLRNFVSGVCARVEQDTVQFPSWYSAKVIAIAEIKTAEIRKMVFDWASNITIVSVDGRRAYIYGANGADAAKFVEAIRVKLPASPANPPAT